MNALEGRACLSWTDLLEQHGLLKWERVTLVSVGNNVKCVSAKVCSELRVSGVVVGTW